jgi:hypothetical protein
VVPSIVLLLKVTDLCGLGDKTSTVNWVIIQQVQHLPQHKLAHSLGGQKYQPGIVTYLLSKDNNEQEPTLPLRRTAIRLHCAGGYPESEPNDARVNNLGSGRSLRRSGYGLAS